MKTISIILLAIITLHQITRPALDGSLIVELGLLALFYFVGGRYIKDYFRSRRRQRYLKNCSQSTVPNQTLKHGDPKLKLKFIKPLL